MKSKSLLAVEKSLGKKVDFHSLLRAIRLTEGLTQASLAKKLKISTTRLCDFEKGRRSPSLELARRMANALNQTPVLFLEQLLEDQLNKISKRSKFTVKIKAA